MDNFKNKKLKGVELGSPIKNNMVILLAVNIEFDDSQLLTLEGEVIQTTYDDFSKYTNLEILGIEVNKFYIVLIFQDTSYIKIKRQYT